MYMLITELDHNKGLYFLNYFLKWIFDTHDFPHKVVFCAIFSSGLLVYFTRGCHYCLCIFFQTTDIHSASFDADTLLLLPESIDGRFWQLQGLIFLPQKVFKWFVDRNVKGKSLSSHDTRNNNHITTLSNKLIFNC